MIPLGYTIAYSNSDLEPCWLVMQLGAVLVAFYGPDGLQHACEWVNERMGENDQDVRRR